EGSLPFETEIKSWETLLAEDPVYLMGHYQPWSEVVFRMYVASYGRLPRFHEFLADVRSVSHGIIPTQEDEETRLQGNLRELADRWVKREEFKAAYSGINDAQYIDRLIANSQISWDE